MKKTLLLLIILSFSIIDANSQTVKGSSQSQIQPASGVPHIKNTSNVVSCNCWQTRDNTWQVAPMDGSGGSGGPGLPHDYRNDDWSTDTIDLPFIFCFYGDTIRQVFINNNGNVSIGGTYATFTANPFPDPTFKMVAPFWADVDTRDSVLSGIVYYKLTNNYLIVQWDHVGYFNQHADKTNTFQLIITDGNSGILAENKNVGFCYKEMEWTTGDASSGVNGFGGTPATVGVNYGDGINYLQIGMYDDSTYAYDGPFGLNDGIHSLSNQSFVFNVCVNAFNVAPILSGEYVCDTVDLCVGDTFTYSANFLSPEGGQITTVTSNTHGLTGVNFITTPGVQASIFMSFIASSTGVYNVDIIGSDDGSPSASSTIPLYFNIQNCGVGIDENDQGKNIIYPNPFENELHLAFKDSKNYITVTDISGRIIFQGNTEQNYNLNTKEWKKGIYFLSVKSTTKTNSYKIIKD
jgi:hypothetical protein